MKLVITLLTSVFFLSCSTDNKKTENMETKFTWNVQLAGYDFDKYDEKGEITLENFLIEFQNFPWIEQIESRNRIQDGCSPTLSVRDCKTATDFWVSMSGDKNNNGYLIGYVYPKMVKGFFGLGKPKETKWVEIYLTENSEVVEQCFTLFFNRETDKFISTIKKLEKYGEMKAEN